MDFTIIHKHLVWLAVLDVKLAHRQMFALPVMRIKTKDFRVLHVYATQVISPLLIPKETSFVTNALHNVIIVNITLIHVLFVTLLKIKLQDMTVQEG